MNSKYVDIGRLTLTTASDHDETFDIDASWIDASTAGDFSRDAEKRVIEIINAYRLGEPADELASQIVGAVLDLLEVEG